MPPALILAADRRIALLYTVVNVSRETFFSFHLSNTIY